MHHSRSRRPDFRRTFTFDQIGMSYRHFAWRLLAAAILVGLLPRPVFAQDHQHAHEPGPYVTLDEIIEQISTRNPELEAAQLRAEALGHRPKQVSAWPDPVLSVGYQPVPMLTAHGRQRTQWMIEQTIPYPRRLGLRREIAALDADVAELESAALLEDLLLEGKEAYFELDRLAEMERLILDFGEQLEGFELAATARYEVGQGQQQALLKTQIEKNRLFQQLHHVEIARRRAAETLARLTHHPDGPRYFITATPVRPRLVDAGPSLLAEHAEGHRPEFAALRAAADRALLEVKLARMEGLPDLSLSVTYHDVAATASMPGSTGRDAVSIGASFRIPIQRSRIRSRIDEARLNGLAIESQQEALRTEYRTRIEELVAVIDHELRAVDEYEEVLLPQAASVVEASRNAYASGTGSYLDLLDAERTVFALRTSHVDTQARLLVAAARLERALGIRTLEDLLILAGSTAP